MSRGEGFGDLSEFWSDGLPLTVGGVTYTVPEPDYQTGLFVQTLFSAGIALAQGRQARVSAADMEDLAQAAQLNDAEEDALALRVLGAEMLAQLAENNVSATKRQHILKTAVVWIAVGEDAAKACWRGEMTDPPAPAPAANRAARRSAAKAPSKATAAGTKTQTRASMTGTRSPRTPSTVSKRTPKAASRGKQS